MVVCHEKAIKQNERKQIQMSTPVPDIRTTHEPWSLFFDAIVDRYTLTERPAALIVSHILPDMLDYLPAFKRLADLAILIGRPHTVDLGTLTRLEALGQRVNLASRDDTVMFGRIRAAVAGVPAEQRLVLIDMGGYFAPMSPSLVAEYGGRLAGIVEDTEVGHRRYDANNLPPCPVVSLARSPFKEGEDWLVGQSIVDSAAIILRGSRDPLENAKACVIGYGKIGHSIVDGLLCRGVRPVVFDHNPVRAAIAAAHGYTVVPTLAQGLRGSRFVFCATGNFALSRADFTSLDDGAYIISATPAEDELDLGAVASWHREEIADHVSRLSDDEGRSLGLLNDGNAVNFVGHRGYTAFAHLVQAEMFAAVNLLSNTPPPPTGAISEVNSEERATIAETWFRTRQSIPEF
jgi:adenosylhomocysteinase